jgi:anti-sigma factor RsiW
MNRSCPDEEMFSDYIEGRLNDNDRSKIEEHLSECDTCLQEIVMANDLIRGAGNIKTDPVPAAVTR